MPARPVLTALLAAGAAALVPTAAIAAPWSAPATVGTAAHTFVGPLDAALAGDGTLVAAWGWQDGVGDDVAFGASGAGRPPGGAFGPEHAAPSFLVDVATYGRTRTVALQQDTGGLRLAYGRADGGFAPSRNLVRADLVYRPQLAVAANGRALIAWIERTRTRAGAQRRIVRAIARRPDGSLTAPMTLSGAGRADGIAVAVSPGGDEAVTLVREGRVLGRVRRPGHHWGSLLELARPRAGTSTTWSLALGIGGAGEVRAIWRRHQRRLDDVPGRNALEGTAMAPGRFRFTAPAQTIEADGASPPVLTPAPGGWALAYVHATADGPRPAARLTDGAATFGPIRYAAAAQGGLRSVAATVAPGAGLTLAWIQPVAGQDGDGLARAATLGADGFGPVEDVSPAEAVHEVRLGADPSTGQPVALWSARPQGTGPGVPIADLRTLVRSAVRAQTP